MAKVAIIGSGMGGLTAGNLLAKKGHDVTLFESHIMPGGYTGGFCRKGFYFESGTVSFESSNLIFNVMKEIGIMDKVKFVKHESRWMSDDFDANITSYGDFKAMMYKAYGDEKQALNAYFRQVDRMYKASKGLSEAPDPAYCTGFERIKAKALGLYKGIKAYSTMHKYIGMTLKEFNRQFFDENSRAYRLLCDYAYPDMSAAFIGASMNILLEDYWTAKDGMQAWADALAENFKAFGGKLMLRSPVERILTKGGKAVGVASNGKVFDADYVISASDYKRTFLQLLDDKSLVPQEQLARIRDSPVSEGVFAVYLGLDMTNEELMKHMKSHYVVRHELSRLRNVADTNDAHYFEDCPFTIYSPSLVNPSLAPEGKSSIMLHALAAYEWMQNWGGGRKGEKYKEMKEMAKKELIRRVGKIIPNLETRILFQEAATPLTYERYTHNTNGASSAWSWNAKKLFFKSPLAAEVETPVKNLYIGSCWAMQIGGVPGAVSAARICANKIR